MTSPYRCRTHLEGPLSRPATKMVRGPVHRRGLRDQCRQPRRRPQGGIRQLALGADENLPELIVPFKRPVYERVVKELPGSRAANPGGR